MSHDEIQSENATRDRAKRSYPLAVLVLIAVNIPLLVAGAVLLPYDYHRQLDDAIQAKKESLDAQALTVFQGLSTGSKSHSKESIQGFIDAACVGLHESRIPDRHIFVRWNGNFLFANGHQHEDASQFANLLRSNDNSDAAMATTPSLVIGSFSEGGTGIYISESTANVRQSILNDLIFHILFLVTLGLTAVVIVNIVLWRIIVGPIRRLSENVCRITVGEYDVSIEDYKSREIESLANSIRQMSNTLAGNELSRIAQMDRAKTIQEHLLPVDVQIPGLSTTCVFQPAETVAGDYYDFIDLQDGTWLICVADVIGHGVPAAMGSAMLKALILHACDHLQDPRQILEFVNSKLPNLLPDEFVTMFVCRWDPKSQSLTFANAGHDPGLLFQSDEAVKELLPSGMPLGINLEEKWTNETIKFEKGHRLLLTTDGVSEACDPQQVPFGRDRLKSMLNGGQDLSANEFVKSVQDAVLSHQQIKQTQDDVTIVLLENTTSGKLQNVA